MPTYDATTATCWVDTFKEGVLSTVGHDVRLEVTSFEVRIDDDGVEATFDPESLRVLHAMRQGEPHLSGLSARDKATIERYVRDDILEARRFRTLRFTADEVELDEGVVEIEGELELHGEREELEVTAERRGDRWVTEVRLHQPTWGIRPFRALMGALKIKPGVVVTLSLPVSALD